MIQALPENVISLMKSLDFIGTNDELNAIKYIASNISLNMPIKPDVINVDVLNHFHKKRFITMSEDFSKIISFNEGFLNRILCIIQSISTINTVEKSLHHSYVLVEGPDCSGKTSIMTYLWEDRMLSNYYIYDRGIISDEVYARKFERKFYKNVDIGTYLSYHKQRTSSLPNLKIIHCTADAYTLADRCILKNDPLVEGKTYETIVKEISRDRLNFDYCIYKFCKDFNIQSLEINTSEKPVEDCVKLAKQFILGDNNGNQI